MPGTPSTYQTNHGRTCARIDAYTRVKIYKKKYKKISINTKEYFYINDIRFVIPYN